MGVAGLSRVSTIRIVSATLSEGGDTEQQQ